jgi:hypothetical protein
MWGLEWIKMNGTRKKDLRFICVTYFKRLCTRVYVDTYIYLCTYVYVDTYILVRIALKSTYAYIHMDASNGPKLSD